MTIEVEIQRASSIPVVPSDPQFRQWAAAALRELDEAELLIRIVDLDESRELNFQFRNRNQATNVLSFPSELPGYGGVGNFSAPVPGFSGPLSR
jgi:probable rRNA maturation factor